MSIDDKILITVVAEEIRKNEILYARITAFANALLNAGKLPEVTPQSSLDDIIDMLFRDCNINLRELKCKIKMNCEGRSNWAVQITWAAPWINESNPFFLEVTGKNPKDSFYKYMENITAIPRTYGLNVLGTAVIQALASTIQNIVKETAKEEPVKEKPIKEEPAVKKEQLIDENTKAELQFQTILDALHVNSIEELRDLVETRMKELGAWDDDADESSADDDYVYEIPMVIRVEGSYTNGLHSVALERMEACDAEDDDCCCCCPICGTPWGDDDDDDDDLDDGPSL